MIISFAAIFTSLVTVSVLVGLLALILHVKLKNNYFNDSRSVFRGEFLPFLGFKLN